MSLRRYSIEFSGSYLEGINANMEEDPMGEWASHSEATAQITALTAERDAARKLIADLEESLRANGGEGFHIAAVAYSIRDQRDAARKERDEALDPLARHDAIEAAWQEGYFRGFHDRTTGQIAPRADARCEDSDAKRAMDEKP